MVDFARRADPATAQRSRSTDPQASLRRRPARPPRLDREGDGLASFSCQRPAAAEIMPMHRVDSDEQRGASPSRPQRAPSPRATTRPFRRRKQEQDDAAAPGCRECRVAWNAALTSSPLLSADAGARRAGIARRCTTPPRPERASRVRPCRRSQPGCGAARVATRGRKDSACEGDPPVRGQFDGHAA
jgi:hypothetical protein